MYHEANLPQFDGSDDDGSLAGVGGVGSEGSIDVAKTWQAGH